MKLLTDQPWTAITRAVRRTPGRCHVAVAYFGQGASRLLPLRRGSVLVLNVNEESVRSGHVCPKDVLTLLRHGVKVHSVANLHAKVFVAGRTVFVGSTNASRTSADTLIEAVVQSTDTHLVRQAVQFVRRLTGDPVREEYVRQLLPLWQPPQGRGRRTAKVVSKRSRTWVVQLTTTPWDPEDHAAEEKGTPVARRRLSRPRLHEVEDFCWTGADFARRVKRHDLVVQVFEDRPKHHLVSPPLRVLHLEPYRSARGGQRSLVFLEKPKNLRRKSLAQIRKKLGRSAAVLRPKSNLTLLRDEAAKQRLLQLWS